MQLVVKQNRSEHNPNQRGNALVERFMRFIGGAQGRAPVGSIPT